MQTTLTRKVRISEDEPYTTGTIAFEQLSKIAVFENKPEKENLFTKTHNCFAVFHHAEIIRARTKTFFNELTHLLMIDNAYRGMGNTSYHVAGNKEDAANRTDAYGCLKTFFCELTAVISGNTGCCGIIKEA